MLYLDKYVNPPANFLEMAHPRGDGTDGTPMPPGTAAERVFLSSAKLAIGRRGMLALH